MSNQIKNFDEFKDKLVKNTELQDQFKKDPVKAIEQYSQSPLLTDKWVYRIVVLALGLTVISIIIGVIILIGIGKIGEDKSVPTILTAIGSAAIGALAGLLAPSPKGNT